MGLKRKCPIIFLIILLAILSIASESEASLRLEPSRFIIHLFPGERETGAITVTNNSDQELDLIATFMDWDLDDRDEMSFHESGTLEESLEGLIRFNPRQFVLKPGESQIVRFTINFPKDEKEPFERRGVIFFEHEEPFEGEGIGATVKAMIGTLIYVLPAEYTLYFEILDGGVQSDSSGQQIAGLYLANPSLVHTRFVVNYQVLAPGGVVIEKGTTKEEVILPQRKKPIFFLLEESYSPGDFRLLVEIDFVGINYKISDSIPFKIED